MGLSRKSLVGLTRSETALYPRAVPMSRKHPRPRRWRAHALLLLACALLIAGCGGRPSIPPPRHLILITVDTWRADHAFTELAGVPLTPRLSELAAESTRFTQASSVADETTPGVTGFLSGLIPRRTGVLVNVNVVPQELPTLATVLQGAGFATRALVANPVLAPGFGFEHGFDHYRLLDRPKGRFKAQADALTDAALRALDEDLAEGGKDRRLFLWVHYLDPHGPYRPPEATRKLFPDSRFGSTPRPVPLLDRGDHSGKGGIPGYQRRGLDPPPVDARDYLARYAAEVRFLDAQVGRLIDGLKARGVLDQSLLVLTADHGEALEGDHGYYFSHNNGQTADQIHVPLLLRCTGCPRGRVIDRPVSTVDVLPTVLELLGLGDLQEDVKTDGIPLLDDRPRLVVSQGHKEISLRSGDWKAIWKQGREPVLYDLRNDPDERHDLAAEQPERLRELSRALREVRARSVVSHATVRGRLRQRAREALRDLGYL